MHSNQVLSNLKLKDTTFILDHPLYPVTKLLQLHCSRVVDQGNELGIHGNWVKINHQIDIGVSIRSISPILRKWGNTQNQLCFDCLRFHIYHIGKVSASKLMRYHPEHNLYHRSDLVGGRMIKNRRGLTLKINHHIRRHNLNIYHQLLQRQPIVLVAESDYGAIVGFAQIQLSSFLKQKYQTPQLLCLQFKQNLKHSQNLEEASIIFRAKAEISVQVSPICPKLQQLHQISRDNPNSRSVSPKRVSKSAGKRSGSGKSKRKVLKSAWMEDGVVSLSVFEGRQYKFQVASLNPTISKQLVYKKVINIGKKKVELVKIGGSYYLKMLLMRQSPDKPGSLYFGFNSVDYRVCIITNTLLSTIELADYLNNTSKEKTSQLQHPPMVLHVGHGEHVFVKDTNRIVKSLARQQVYDGLLSTVHLKSGLSCRQIYCNKPFMIYEIVHKEDGYLITYYYRQQVIRQAIEKTLVFYINDGVKATEVHVFDCLVKQRSFDRETLCRQLQIPNDEVFLKLSMKLITHQSYQYQIYSADEQHLTVVNGQNFRYQPISNQYLEIQIMKSPFDILSTDIIFYDNRGKSFFLRIILRTLPNLAPS